MRYFRAKLYDSIIEYRIYLTFSGFSKPKQQVFLGGLPVISPVRDTKRRKKFKKALKSTNIRYGRALKKLAE